MMMDVEKIGFKDISFRRKGCALLSLRAFKEYFGERDA